MKKALITGVTGQDGYYLSQLLREKGYHVVGLVRRTSQEKQIPPNIEVLPGDVTDPAVRDVVAAVRPDEIYHLAAMSNVAESFRIPTTTFKINALGTLNMLQAARVARCKFYNAATSELFGDSMPPQNEHTRFAPRSPYGVAKLAAYWATVNYREAYGLFACNGILFNHESPRRGLDFVTRKICRYVAQGASSGFRKKLKLGNVEARRDWGHAKDYVRGMWLMMQKDKPDNYVLATGRSRTVRDVLDQAFRHVAVTDWKQYVEVDSSLYRPSDVHYLVGDAAKAMEMGWRPEISFEKLIVEMVDSELCACQGYDPDIVNRAVAGG